MARVTPEQLQLRREQILSAAITCFARKGCAQSTMQDVATEAGLSVGALYRYFPGKDDLIASVFDGIGQRTNRLFAEASEGADSPGETLRRAGLILEERLRGELSKQETMLVLEGILADARDPSSSVGGGRQLRGAYIFLTERLFRQAQEEGSLHPDMDVRGLASLFVSLVVGIHVLHLELGDSLSLQTLLDAVDDMMDRLAAPGEGAQGSTIDDIDDMTVSIGGRG